jgi:hypothetical protein
MDKRVNRSFLPSIQNGEKPLSRVFYAFLPYDETTGDVNPYNPDPNPETRPVVGVRRITVNKDGEIRGLQPGYVPELGEQVVWTVI